MSVATSTVPVLNLDPFSDEFLSNPHKYHKVIRDTGPVVKLTRYNVWAMGRFQEVQACLKDWETFCSGRGVGLTDFAREKPWRPPSLLLEADPPLHDRTRGVIRRILTPGVLKALRPVWREKAEILIEALVRRKTFDAITDLAEIYPLSVFPDAIGIRQDGRENLLPYSTMAFNAFGPRNHLTEESMKDADQIVAWVAESCKRTSLADGSIGAQVFDAVDRGEITEDEAERLIRSFVTAGMDTTVNGIGNLLHAFATHPDQWDLLRERPELVPYALEESLRFNSTVQTFFRTTTREVEVAGTVIPEGQKVLLFLAAANRDERHWSNPEKFDLGRKTTGHVGFGAGPHVCIGQMIARLEVELVLRALMARVTRIELAGIPKLRLNNTLQAFGSVPVKVT